VWILVVGGGLTLLALTKGLVAAGVVALICTAFVAYRRFVPTEAK
jgi:hypothetical protein